ncbi:MAG: TonB family protein [Flavipsychrobacter sp.]|nr:TonB family protein [Flavipsychrobacter sp.]
MLPTRLLLIVSFLVLPIICFSQKTFHIRKRLRLSDTTTVLLNRVAWAKVNNRYKVEDHFLNGQLEMSGYVLLGKPGFDIMDGYVTYYDQTGFKTQEGNYDNGRQTGIWKIYFKSSDSLAQIIDHKTDSTMLVTGYDSVTRSILYEGITSNKGRIGTWKWYYPLSTNAIKTLQVYQNHKIAEEKFFYENGGLRKVESYRNDTIFEGHAYDSAGKELPYILPIVPRSKIDLIAYLHENLVYPKFARRRNIEGRVIIKFAVDEKGDISDVTVAEAIGGGCDEEAVRVVSMMPAWQPGMQDAKPVRSVVTLPILFELK